MKEYRNFFLWIVSAAMIAATIAYFLPDSYVNPRPGPPVARGRAAAVSRPVQNISSSSSSKTEFIAQASQAAPAERSSAEIRTLFQLRDFIEKNPGEVKSLAFDLGSGKVTLYRNNAAPVSLLLPDSEARVELRKRADELRIAYDVIPAPPPAPSAPVVVAQASGGGFSYETFLYMGIFIVASSVIGFFIQRWLMTRSQAGAAGGARFSNMVKSRARDTKKLNGSLEKITFDDVAGCDEAVSELRRIVEGFKNGE
ncbi:MAG: hypothetical protein K2X27_14745, partial [Candidatus Obscuribacterales bacterium]|nr:hypothetical protein [Candidatus Obscuribacterales bacterium]